MAEQDDILNNLVPDENPESEKMQKLEKDLADTIAQSESYLAGWKRTQADLDNYRKKKESEGAEMIRFGKQAAFVQLLPIMDSLEQAMKQSPSIEDSKYKNWKIGLDGIVKQMESTLKEMQIEKIETVGKKFDPNFHEAVKEFPGLEDDMVVEQYQTGYMIEGKLLRPAQVAVSKKHLNTTNNT
jgi:molecular chaperone GrpE